eukprot:TRINITY_DN340_c21_g1_i3.p4 TRINITY_DN340_c21_g1~~TRINITY_DN340_c21_g1_i3.p4  ORF type:complete len:143 (-),score=2.03 TRINITY_DN340_c21_g1_i3:110-538(-)
MDENGQKRQKGQTVDALAPAGDEGRGRLRQASGSRQAGFEPRISEWGNPAGVISGYPLAECIGLRKRTQGSETSQYLEEKKSSEIPSVAASERGLAQTMHFRVYGVVGPSYEICTQQWKQLGSCAIESDSLVHEIVRSSEGS